MKIDHIHIGELIKEKVKERGLPVVQFAEIIHKDRGGVYRLFKSPTIDTESLVRISNALDHNFFAEFCPDKQIYPESASFVIKKVEENQWQFVPVPDDLHDLILSRINGV